MPMDTTVHHIGKNEENMPKKALPGKSGDYGFYHDSPEQINKCLNCTRAACINCYEVTADDEDCVDYDRPLLPVEIRVLEAYAVSKDDAEISARTGISKPKIFRHRKALGLPPVLTLSEYDKQLIVDRWMRR